MVKHEEVIRADGSKWDHVTLDGELMMLVKMSREEGDEENDFVRYMGDFK